MNNKNGTYVRMKCAFRGVEKKAKPLSASRKRYYGPNRFRRIIRIN